MMKIRNPQPKVLDGSTSKFVGLSGRDRGLAVQQSYEDAGITTNWAEGLDLPQFGEEIKTFTPSNDITIGTYKSRDLLNTDGKVCLNKLGCAHQWHEFDKYNVKRKTHYVDLRLIHDIIERDLKALTDDFRTNPGYGKWTCAKSKYFILEWTRPESKATGVKLRIRASKVKNLITLAGQPTFNKLFKEVV